MLDIIALLCTSITTKEIPLREEPQHVAKVIEYQACTNGDTLVVQGITYFKIDGHTTSRSDPEVLWKFDIKVGTQD